jgi:sensor c-di-GMP phosphodiesterase-like protein
VASQVRVDILKIDRSYVAQMARNNYSSEVMATLASLISAADVAVIAEGVETGGQVVSLRDAGVGMAQGWYFSQPLSAADFMEYFSAHQ